MTERDAKLQAVALRLAADRAERGEQLSQELTAALAGELERHPEDVEQLAAFEALEQGTPAWHIEELDRRDREDSGGDPWPVVKARILVRARRTA
ncbi:hypothetical protein [Pendulispora albinea]|uniref:Uncharacterized protein n=1 Tax=Pendulispora albinea TaxID=2741071 RepID=A0ABZ2LQ89_9BACT